MKSANTVLAACLAVVTLATSASAMPIIEIDETITGGMDSFTVTSPVASSGTDATLNLGATFSVADPGFSVQLVSMGGLTDLDVLSSSSFPFGRNNTFLVNSFLVPGDLIAGAMTFTFQITSPLRDGNGNVAIRNFVGELDLNAIPEPATMTLLGMGAVAGIGAIRRKRNAPVLAA